MVKLIFSLIFLSPFVLAAQVPWSNLAPKLNNAYYRENGDPGAIKLKLDTLFAQSNEPESFDRSLNPVISTWYDKVDKYGYGYVDEEGNPFGIWRYYIKTPGGYEKFCEGTYIKLQPKNLIVTDKVKSLLSATRQEEEKEAYLQFSVAQWLFTSEWRFYKNKQLQKIIAFDDVLEMDFVESVDDNNVTTILVKGDNYKGAVRNSGRVLSSVFFDINGNIQSIRGPIDIDFTGEGKPLFKPL